jgi:alginate O-acetyltransferase complex protein AlgI
MLFNSITFAIFLPIVFSLYWYLNNFGLRAQNVLLLVASWIFYGWWDWRFLLLLITMSVLNYFIGIEIDKNDSKKRSKIWLIFGLTINLGILGFFKYFNFFIDGFIDLISLIGYSLPRSTTKIILPLGISFYTFISLSYLINIFKQNQKANRKIIDVLLSLSFFPIILAGPIQRPSSLLPQIAKKREFSCEMSTQGLKQIIWGLFTKVVIADNLALFVDEVFSNYPNYRGSVLLIGAVFYAVQIYADFSGYSNMAIGIAKLFGFSLMQNFAYPYFSRDITEFWKKWHISLTTWFRDYLFLPLSFAISWKIKGEKVFFIRSVLFIYILTSIITWFLTGLWHGANYTFIIWGMIHGLLLIFYRLQIRTRKRLFQKFKINSNNKLIIFVEFLVTMCIITIAWIFFRSDTVEHAINYINLMFSDSLFSIPKFHFSRKIFLVITILTVAFFVIEWFGRNNEYALACVGTKQPLVARWIVYYLLLFIIFFFAGSNIQFIYFQF